MVVTPTAHLKPRWANAAHRVGLQLDPSWSPADALAGDLHGIVTTYQQVASAAPALRAVATDAVVILDEIHHAADERAWGDSVRVAFGEAARRLALSGTPFRSDTSPIPFIDDVLDEARSAQRLRTALSLDGQWLPTVLRSAHERLTAIRAADADAAGLVIATDQDHARGIADIMRWRRRVDPVVVTSDDPTASAHIARFAAGTEPWLIAVRMVSEGVDIPRLEVGVYATTTTTELFFRQAVGRLVRWRRGARRHQAFLYLPDDPRLRARALQIADGELDELRDPDRQTESVQCHLRRGDRPAGTRRSLGRRPTAGRRGRGVRARVRDRARLTAGRGQAGHPSDAEQLERRLRHAESCLRKV